MLEGKFFKISCQIILILIIIFLLGQIPYLTRPLSKVLYILLFPILLGGFLYYLLRPVVRFLTTKIKHKNLAILITFLLVILLILVVTYFGGSIIYTETRKLISYFTSNYDTVKANINQIIKLGNGRFDFLAQFNLQQRFNAFMQEILSKFSNYNFMGAFSSLTNIGTVIILIPFVLFYFLKDDQKIYYALLGFFSDRNKSEIDKLLQKIDCILATYINGQLIVAFILGVCMLIGYLIIGLPNAVALALIAMITSIIPILGPTLGILPALFIATSNDWLMVINVFIVLAIAQQLEGNLIRPVIQGEQLNIHPLIVLFVVLISILLFGILGALFAVPAYAVSRILIKNLSLFKARKVIEDN